MKTKPSLPRTTWLTTLAGPLSWIFPWQSAGAGSGDPAYKGNALDPVGRVPSPGGDLKFPSRHGPLESGEVLPSGPGRANRPGEPPNRLGRAHFKAFSDIRSAQRGRFAPPSKTRNSVTIAVGLLLLPLLLLLAFGCTCSTGAQSVLGWGYDNMGQATPPADLTNAVAISGGEAHSLALRADGTVVAWGTSANAVTNVPTDLTNVIAISAGLRHNLVLQSDGSVVAWGNDNYGQSTVPASLTNVMAIATQQADANRLWSEISPRQPQTWSQCSTANSEIRLVARYSMQGRFWSIIGFYPTEGAPELSIGASSDGYINSWSRRTDDWLLEFTSTLDFTAQTWSEVSRPYQMDSNRCYTTIPATPGRRLYRLRRSFQLRQFRGVANQTEQNDEKAIANISCNNSPHFPQKSHGRQKQVVRLSNVGLGVSGQRHV